MRTHNLFVGSQKVWDCYQKVWDYFSKSLDNFSEILQQSKNFYKLYYFEFYRYYFYLEELIMSIFLKHPLPYEDENIASYLNRLADVNFASIMYFYDEFYISLHQKPEKLIKSLSEKSIKYITIKTGFEKSAIYNMTLKKYENIEKNNLTYMVNFIDNDNKYCPVCLRDKVYARLKWKLNCVKVCVIHNTLLSNRCTKCNNLVKYIDININKCSFCGTKLSDNTPIYFTDEHINDNQNLVNNICNEILNTDCLTGSATANFNNNEYLHFYNFINDYIINVKGSSDTISSNLSRIFLNYNDLDKLIVSSKLIDEWPTFFISLMDDYHDKMPLPNYKITNKLQYDNLCNLINPLSPICTKMCDHTDIILKPITKKLYSLSVTLTNYFKCRYNLDFFMKKLNNYVDNRGYVDLEIAKLIMNVGYEDIRLLFIKDTTDDKYRLYDLVHFMKEIIIESDFIYSHSETRDYFNIERILNLFKNFNITLYDVLKIIKEKRVVTKIYPLTKFGVEMIYFSEKEMSINLLELCLDKLRH